MQKGILRPVSGHTLRECGQQETQEYDDGDTANENKKGMGGESESDKDNTLSQRAI